MSQTQQLASPRQQAPLKYMHANSAGVVPAEIQEIPQWITWGAGAPNKDGKGKEWEFCGGKKLICFYFLN